MILLFILNYSQFCHLLKMEHSTASTKYSNYATFSPISRFQACNYKGNRYLEYTGCNHISFLNNKDMYAIPGYSQHKCCCSCIYPNILYRCLKRYVNLIEIYSTELHKMLKINYT